MQLSLSTLGASHGTGAPSSCGRSLSRAFCQLRGHIQFPLTNTHVNDATGMRDILCPRIQHQSDLLIISCPLSCLRLPYLLLCLKWTRKGKEMQEDTHVRSQKTERCMSVHVKVREAKRTGSDHCSHGAVSLVAIPRCLERDHIPLHSPQLQGREAGK